MPKMSFEECLAIDMESIAMYESGREEEAMALHRAKTPMYPWLAKIMKEKAGADYLITQTITPCIRNFWEQLFPTTGILLAELRK